MYTCIHAYVYVCGVWRKGMCVRDRLSNLFSTSMLASLASLIVNSEQYNATPVGSPCNQAHDDRLSTCRSNALSCIGII
jgi:hypothetical protein